MGFDDSGGVTSLVGLDEFVVSAQVHDTVAAAKAEFETFAEDWGEKYPAMIRSWENSWAEFVPFLEFPADLRKLV